jgi:hypothetical protein
VLDEDEAGPRAGEPRGVQCNEKVNQRDKIKDRTTQSCAKDRKAKTKDGATQSRAKAKPEEKYHDEPQTGKDIDLGWRQLANGRWQRLPRPFNLFNVDDQRPGKGQRPADVRKGQGEGIPHARMEGREQWGQQHQLEQRVQKGEGQTEHQQDETN